MTRPRPSALMCMTRARPRRSWPTAWVSSGAISLRTASSIGRGRAGQQEHQRGADDAGVGARQHRGGPDLLERQHAEQLAEAGQPAVEQRADRFGRAIARSDAGAARDDTASAVARQARHRRRAAPPAPPPAGRRTSRENPAPSINRRSSRPPSFVSGVRLSEAVTIATRTAAADGDAPCGERPARKKPCDAAPRDQRTRNPATRPATPAPASPAPLVPSRARPAAPRPRRARTR